MLEYWNHGIMGYGKMVECYYGEIHLDIETEMLINYEYSFSNQHSNLPSFHYSIYEAKFQTLINTYKFNKLYNFRDVKLTLLHFPEGKVWKRRT